MILATDIWEFEYPVINIIFGIIFSIIGFSVMWKNKSYKINFKDMRNISNAYAKSFFFWGLFVGLLGISIIIKGIIKYCC